MTKADLQKRLSSEVARWAEMNYRELAETAFPVVYESGSAADGSFCQTEVTLLENTPDYIHVAVAVSDSGLRAFVPLVDDVIVRADRHG